MFLSVLLLFPGVPQVAQAQDLVRAKIGMEIVSDGKSRPARARDRLKLGDSLRILVSPEDDAFVYVIYTDGETASLLNTEQAEQKLQKDSLKVFPSLEDLYQPDGAEGEEKFTIIYSQNPLAEVTAVFNEGEAPHSKWLEVEEKLASKPQVLQAETVEKNLTMGGTVRGDRAEPLVNKLRTSSGKSVIVKQYQFHVKK